MEKPIKAGVVVAHMFVDKNATRTNGKDVETFAGYINYIDRNEAIRSENFTKFNLSSQYANYHEYMGNPEKSTGLFTAATDTLNREQVQALKDAFQMSYDNDNIMWQTVVSFDNRFLAQLGIFDPETGVLDEGLLRSATRRMMRDTLRHENMAFTAVWSAAIHYNTDNIHIHVAYTEPLNTRQKKEINGVERPRGYFSAKTIRSMKSKMVNHLLEHQYTFLDKLVRERFVNGLRDGFTPEDKQLRDLWFRIYDNLPKDKRQWFYNMNGMDPLRPLLDELSRQYIMGNHPAEYMQFQQTVIKQQAIYEAAYGAGKGKLYAENKMNDLYTRMGNAILAEMRQYARSPYAFIERSRRGSRPSTAYNLVGGLRRALRQAFGETQKQNQREYQKLQAELDHGGYS